MPRRVPSAEDTGRSKEVGTHGILVAAADPHHQAKAPDSAQRVLAPAEGQNGRKGTYSRDHWSIRAVAPDSSVVAGAWRVPSGGLPPPCLFQLRSDLTARLLPWSSVCRWHVS